jgi:hypothetical protein
MKKRNNKNTGHIPLGKIREYVQSVQSRLANKIGNGFSCLPKKFQYTILLGCFFSGSLYCILLLLGAGSGGLPDSGKIKQMVLLKPPTADSTKTNVLEKVQHIREHLDSLSSTNFGTQIRDSIISANPGLMDSLKNWEQQLGIQNQLH